jgi:hypothetical protein
MNSKLSVRYATIDDLDSLYEVEQTAWNNNGASKETLFQRLISSANYTILILYEKKIIGFTQIKKLSDSQIQNTGFNWYNLMNLDADENGSYMFGYNLSGIKANLNTQLGIKSLEATYEATVEQNCKCMFAGGRMINYKKWSIYNIKPELYPLLLKNKDSLYYDDNYNLFKIGTIDYNEKKINWIAKEKILNSNLSPSNSTLLEVRSLDSIINLYRKAKFFDKNAEFIGVVDNYFDDTKSNNYGLLYAWSNPFLENNDSINFIKKSFNYRPLIVL